MPRYFLTGATGFLGGRLARQLRDAGHEVVTVARNPDRAGDLRATGVQVHRGDITDRASLVEPMRGADGVFHVAAWYKVGANAAETRTARAINVDGTRNVLEVMRDLGVPKGVHTSTLAVFGDTRGRLVDEAFFQAGPWVSEYDHTKWSAHYEVAVPMMQMGLPLVIVQPGLIYGPGDHSMTRATLLRYLQRRLPALPEGSAYCWSHVDDIARAHVLAMEKGRAGESYIIAGPRHSIVEAMAIAEKITGIPAPKGRLSPGLLRVLAFVMGVAGRVMPVSDDYRSETLRVMAGVTYLGDNAKARRELGYAPRPLAEGLRTVLEAEMRGLGMAGSTA